ncbi:MAG TPA: DUF4249 domain-containing protein [Puia sp.]|nr:DUF4249 domain-containing protein [Puia sp.]
MQNRSIKIVLIALLVICCFDCRKAFNPPATAASNHFLAVDGFINTGTNAVSTFTVMRSLNLSDSVPHIPELNASVQIVGSGGDSYSLIDTGGTGVYISPPLNLNPNQQYQLAVTTSDGNQYHSDMVTPKPAPPIDSLNWVLSLDPVTNLQTVKIFVNSHDPTNNTRYYRWDYVETWEHASVYETPWGVKDSMIYPYPVGYSTHYCWTTDNSHSIIIGSSIALSQDVISQGLIETFYQNDPKMDIGYSMLVRQYPLSEEAYNYWLTVQKNSQSLGGLFDLQPAQITGNIHSITHPGDPVLGYVSASSVTEQRIYIDNHSLGWKSNPAYSCPEKSVATDPLNTLAYSYPDTAYGPYHFSGDQIIVLVVAPKSCMDCRYQGGVNIKPSFWP